ncbi:DUF3995 domain-containing protein [Arsenicitalea aurantiaca]|uniref:DUF3995 domain-containing protein n=1 Tax=Arsenicitalea aurantiaca TaxID=1783274 RepID=A0A433XLW7_9HYPH|nr:DUF3995 domain-containing protein [Arsenicitalea aurantiaca]RUT35076.1 DUF3995 domain-containing protein [Arsenicitalea aurantiaca]
MSMLVAALIFVPLLAAALALLLWSFGASWPIRDRALLAATMRGAPGATAMWPKTLSFLLFLVALALGVLSLALADHDGGGWVLTLTGAVIGIVFLARGVLGYTEGWKARTPNEPFRTLDRKTYSPVCLVIGTGFVVLALMRLL